VPCVPPRVSPPAAIIGGGPQRGCDTSLGFFAMARAGSVDPIVVFELEKGSERIFSKE